MKAEAPMMGLSLDSPQAGYREWRSLLSFYSGVHFASVSIADAQRESTSRAFAKHNESLSA
jgi:hypothetical protein